MKHPPEAKTRRIAGRLGLHFTAQFFAIWVSVLITVFVSVFALFYFTARDQIRSDLPDEVLSSLSLEAVIDPDGADLPDTWKDQLKDMGYWLQIVNRQGSVVYSANAPNEVPGRYSAVDLLRIDSTGQWDEYDVATLYEEFDGVSSLYLLGRLDQNRKVLERWFGQYADEGKIRTPDGLRALDAEVRQRQGSLRVLDSNGRIVQSAGTDGGVQNYGALDLVANRFEPAKSKIKYSSFYDETTGYTWLLETPRTDAAQPEQPLLRTVILVSAVVGAVILLLALGLAAWHGYRYGGPLLLFIRGFERMGRGEYEQVFTEKEQRRIFRKNGRFRARYKLYREVIDGFSDMADRLAEARNERLRLERSREEWMAGISHDLRTPLSAVQGYGHLLESGQFRWSEQELLEMGATIREKSSYMLELLQDFSLTFELKNHTPGERLEPMELNEFVRRAVLRYVNDPAWSDVSFEFEENGAPIRIMANAKWFQRLLDNLISNAVKHNGAGTAISIEVRREEGSAVVTVRDDGVGMDEQTQARLFDRYYRGTSTDENVDGSGLGMSIAHAVVTAHLGTIAVRSSPGNGTVIALKFPAL
ncbi:two-component sensor histidine kinase [Saccharibacillus sp. O23]|uniref:sensor histidine kinase n=1 Tax=Saccharibacillus sp. O23 TaxID=2009338 RepID=UPI000B4E10A2|nr:HAMP domain-containing sensor histidine kinase [Saccharibacillus sp. O23]OWR27125.1 two-component sensor histidine kinase [Saccharibacillus sp. O23]